MPYKNIEDRREQSRRWRLANLEKEKVRCAKYRQEHPEQCKESHNKWKRNNPEKLKEQWTKYRLMHNYGITKLDWDIMFEKQKGCCALCNESFGDNNWMKPVVDHNHITGKVRGLLHRSCNLLLGYVNDNELKLQLGIDYLHRTR